MPLRIVSPAATSSLEMYTAPVDAPVDDEAVAEDVPATPGEEDELEEGALTYTSYWVGGYITPRICPDEVSTWDTTAAVVTVAGGAAASAASCCGDFTNDAPISPPTASNAAAIPAPTSTRRRRASRELWAARGRPPSSGPLSVAGEPSCVTRSSVRL
jgi:hypothetical protein